MKTNLRLEHVLIKLRSVDSVSRTRSASLQRGADEVNTGTVVEHGRYIRLRWTSGQTSREGIFLRSTTTCMTCNRAKPVAATYSKSLSTCILRMMYGGGGGAQGPGQLILSEMVFAEQPPRRNGMVPPLLAPHFFA